jgi:threonine 3-dehydrogenase
MLAYAKVAPETNGLALIHKEVRSPDAGEILIRMSAAGICGSDVQIYKWAPRYVNWIQLPRIIGHEMSGVVVQVGAGVDNVKTGDHVSLESHIACGVCHQCKTNRAHVCPNTRYPGVHVDGAFAEFVTVPASIAWVNPPDAPEHLTAVLEPFGIAMHATLEGTGVAGQSVLINGCGPIGLMNVGIARHFGAQRIIGVDPNPLRRKAALAMGADMVIDPANENVLARVNDLTHNQGADVVFEYTGQPEGVINAFACLTVGGDLRWCATPPHAMQFDFNMMRNKRPTVYNIHGRRLWETWVKGAPLIYENKIDLTPVLTHTLPLSEAARAFELILSGQAGKPLLVPD